MNRLPKIVQDLFFKYGDCEVIRNIQNVPSNQQSLNQEPLYGVGVFVITEEGEYVLLRHSYNLPGISTDDWTFPGGKLEENESFEDAAIRETFEETGMIIRITGLYKIFHHILVSSNGMKSEWFMPVFFGEILSEVNHHESPEITEIRKFKKLPKNFAGELRNYYEDLFVDT
jgi:8-oxo-dGTP pyrophosphatase MutT (NUDIX family)